MINKLVHYTFYMFVIMSVYMSLLYVMKTTAEFISKKLIELWEDEYNEKTRDL